MPAKNARKHYLENGYYHIYNRGVEKRKIFSDDQDYSVFLRYFKEYLTPKDEQELMDIVTNKQSSPSEKDKALKLLKMNNFSGEVDLLAYCLMLNHFHLFIKQKSSGSIGKFMNSLGTRYTMYFNKKYKRNGHLYEGVYKAVSVETEEQFIYLSKYIHKQALASQGLALRDQPSSFENYIGVRKTDWVKSEPILSYFSYKNPSLSYKSFVMSSMESGYTPVNNIIIEGF